MKKSTGCTVKILFSPRFNLEYTLHFIWKQEQQNNYKLTERYEYSVNFTSTVYNFICSTENRLFYEAGVQLAIVQISANYPANYDKPWIHSQMVKNGADALSTTIPTYTKKTKL